MACVIAPLLFVLAATAASDTETPSCPQSSHSLIQTKRNVVTAEPVANAPKHTTVPDPGAKGSALSRLAMRAFEVSKDSSLSLLSRPKKKKVHVKTALLSDGHSDGGQSDSGRSSTGLGARAALDERGYVSVAGLKDDDEMKSFILRAIADRDCEVLDEAGLTGIVPWFSGTSAVQTFDELEDSLLSAVLANGHRWLSYKNSVGVTGADSPLDLQGYAEVSLLRSDDEMDMFARRLAEADGIEITDNGGLAGMIKYCSSAALLQSFDQFRKHMRMAASHQSWAKFIKP